MYGVTGISSASEAGIEVFFRLRTQGCCHVCVLALAYVLVRTIVQKLSCVLLGRRVHLVHPAFVWSTP